MDLAMTSPCDPDVAAASAAETVAPPTPQEPPPPGNDLIDIACILEFTSPHKDAFDEFILASFNRLHMPMVKCSRKSRVDLVDGRAVKEICTQKYRCDLGGRPTPKKDGVKTRRSKSKRLDCSFSFNATMLKTTRVWGITVESKARILGSWGSEHHGHCHVLDDQQLRVRRLAPDAADVPDANRLDHTNGQWVFDSVTSRLRHHPNGTSSRPSHPPSHHRPSSVEAVTTTNPNPSTEDPDPTSLGSLMAQSSSILTALMQAETLEASAKSEAVLRSVHDHANTLRLALEQLTATIKAHHTHKQQP
ncbi:hypothetical protein H257_03709 [Aphanomyces astaci]|uniref:Uncharacterized protein n=1 Tax=Aphanomyces astaci TaxID=112090 RepID=W4GYX3_APHAT|nr:hypothetical protein H257_03709 [Aphanomyces astaci]ETV84531.1 hypothetical protein H257_03709 [Aphanomyces astaci]|eukprot:XP_009826223.1 hypothetical protein H257_03709 [Aphanomyces astaci]